MKKLVIIECLNISKEMIDKMMTKIPEIEFLTPYRSANSATTSYSNR
jgi:hypothetical protein